MDFSSVLAPQGLGPAWQRKSQLSLTKFHLDRLHDRRIINMTIMFNHVLELGKVDLRGIFRNQISVPRPAGSECRFILYLLAPLGLLSKTTMIRLSEI